MQRRETVEPARYCGTASRGQWPAYGLKTAAPDFLSTDGGGPLDAAGAIPCGSHWAVGGLGETYVLATHGRPGNVA